MVEAVTGRGEKGERVSGEDDLSLVFLAAVSLIFLVSIQKSEGKRSSPILL